jgi:hypothetical protein
MFVGSISFLEIRKGSSGAVFVTEVDMKKAINYFANLLHLKNISLRDLSEVRLMLGTLYVRKGHP